MLWISILLDNSLYDKHLENLYFELCFVIFMIVHIKLWISLPFMDTLFRVY